MVRCGGLRGAGGNSTDARIAANIERGFCPKLRQYLDDPGWRNGAPPPQPLPTAPRIFDLAKLYSQKRDETPDPTRLMIIDEAERLKTVGLEQIRDIFDHGELGVVLCNFPNEVAVMWTLYVA
jgi:hypothetical protein